MTAPGRSGASVGSDVSVVRWCQRRLFPVLVPVFSLLDLSRHESRQVFERIIDFRLRNTLRCCRYETSSREFLGRQVETIDLATFCIDIFSNPILDKSNRSLTHA